jgi:hypothetical protein
LPELRAWRVHFSSGEVISGDSDSPLKSTHYFVQLYAWLVAALIKA